MIERISVTVTVGGKEYTFMTTDSPAHVKRVAAYVDRLLMETTAAGAVGREMAAVVSALTMADELIKAQDDNTRLRRELSALRGETKEE